MNNNQGYKNQALADLNGNWGTAAVVTLIYLLLTAFASEGFNFFGTPGLIVGSSVVWHIVCMPLSYGFTVMFLDFIRKQDDLTIGKMFEPYARDLARVLTTYLLMYVYIILWMLLLIVPGIIKSFSYAMTPYILKDNPELANNSAIEKSMQMMNGHKMQLFWLYLSFIGWAILSLCTLGIGFLFLIPYMDASIAHFYEDLKAEQQA